MSDRAEPLLWDVYNTDKSASREKWIARLNQLQLVLQQNPHHPAAYLNLAACYRELGRSSDGLPVLEEGLKQCPPDAEIYSSYIAELRKCNRHEEAIRVAHQGFLALPGEGDRAVMRIKEHLTLPILYDTPEEVDRYRRRFQAGLAAFRRETTPDTTMDRPAGRAAALQALSAWVTFDLLCQGRDDRDLLHQYGQLLQRVMAANFPQWSAAPVMPPLGPGGKLRVGYVSSCFHQHSVMKIYSGWFQEHDRSRIDVYTYHVGRKTDATTREVEQTSTRFLHVPGDLPGVCEAVVRDRLHILVFLDIGMHPLMGLMGAVRLAPVQCVTWGHPVTSGLDTIGYYLSSSLMEPDDADAHYSERLVRLPGIGVWYRKPVIPRPILRKKRADFGLREDATVYLSCQAIHKYLPEHDPVYAEIAARAAPAQLVFLAPNELVAADFRKRLERAFAAVGLKAGDCCVMLPEMSGFDYWNLNLISDVYLDTMTWSGGNTTMEAIACDLPVVTLPGKFMRGRHSYAMLTQLGVTETIARDEASYVDLAVRLGADREWRKSVVARMRERLPHLFGDRSSVRALEEFYEREVRKRLQAGEA